MSMYIVDCRYPFTTTPLGQPDFTLEVEANSPEHAIQVAEEMDDQDEYLVTGACETLPLVEMLRSHVRILAEFGLEMARKSREAGTDVAEFEALVSANGIAMPDGDEDDEDEDDEEDPWHGEYISDLRKREAKLAFEHYDFTAYGGVEDLVGWFGIGDEEHALIRLGGYAEPEHVFVVEFAEDQEARIVHVGVEPFEKTPWRHIHHYDGAIIKYNRQTS